MQTSTEPNIQREPLRIPLWLGLCLFLAIAAFFLLEEHRAHILGLLPYVLLLLCPIIHFFMHRGQGGDSGAQSGHEGHASSRREEGEAS